MLEKREELNKQELKYFDGVSLRQEDSVWKLKTPDGEIILPKELGRHLYFAIKLIIGFIVETKGNPIPDRLSKKTFTRAVSNFECFTFVARSMGWKLPIKFLRNPSHTSHIQLFRKEKYLKLENAKEIIKHLEEISSSLNSNIFVGQMYDDKNGYVTHTFFALNINGVFYEIAKNGMGGGINVDKIENSFKNTTDIKSSAYYYGNRFAFTTYNSLHEHPVLIDHYSKPHFTE